MEFEAFVDSVAKLTTMSRLPLGQYVLYAAAYSVGSMCAEEAQVGTPLAWNATLSVLITCLILRCLSS